MALISLVPKLTSNTSHPPIVVSSSSVYSSSYEPYCLFNQAIDSTSDSGWVTSSGMPINGQWAQIAFGESKEIDELWVYQYRGKDYTASKISISYSINGSNFVMAAEDILLEYNSYESNVIAKYKLPSRIICDTMRITVISGGSFSSYVGINEIQIFKDTARNQKFIIKDNNNYKTVTNCILEDLGTILPSVAIIEEKGISDINIILTSNIIDNISNTFNVISLSNDSAQRALNLSAIPEPQLLIPTNDINLKLLESLQKVKVTTQGSGGIIKVAVSFDSGQTWKKYNDGLWIDIALDKQSMKTEGITLEQLSVIPKQNWDLAFVDKKIRFAYYLEYDSADQTLSIDNLLFTADMLGTWKRAFHGTDYDYQYSSNTTLEVKVLTDGTYKINYGEFNVEPNGPGSGSEGTGTSNIIALGIPSNEFQSTVDGVYKYRWIHNKNTKHVIFNAVDQETGNELLMTTQIIDANTIDILINEPRNVYLTAIM